MRTWRRERSSSGAVGFNAHDNTLICTHAEEAHEIAREGVKCSAVTRPMFTVSAKSRFAYATRAKSIALLCSVLQATLIIQENHLYRLVVVDDQNNTPLAIINQSHILRFLFSHVSALTLLVAKHNRTLLCRRTKCERRSCLPSCHTK